MLHRDFIAVQVEWNLLLHPANYGVAGPIFTAAPFFCTRRAGHLSFDVFFYLFVPKVTRIALELSYICFKCAERHRIVATGTTMDPRWNLLRNGIITVIASIAFAFGLALLSGGAKAAFSDNSTAVTGLFAAATSDRSGTDR